MSCLNETKSLADELCPTTTPTYFSEIVICEHLTIPPNKPEKELITNVTKSFVVSDVELLEVDLGDRDYATSFLRKKVVITGILKLGIEYSAAVPEQEVHFALFNIPFQAIIGERPCDAMNRGLINLQPFDLDDYKVHICLEHEQYHQLGPREIKAVLVLIVWLEHV